MKHYSNNRQAILSSLATSGFALAAGLAAAYPLPAAAQTVTAATAPGSVEMMGAMNGLNPANKQMPMTGNVDRDFMIMMIQHHNAGIAMSAAEAAYGKHTPLKNMAVVDIHDQEKDNRDMRHYLQHPTTTETTTASNPAAEKDVMGAMQMMNQSMTGMKLNGKPDHDFIMMMIPHHEAAIEMSKAELKYGSDPRVQKVAQGVIDGQTKDIKDMTGWHKEWFEADYPMK